ncbi:MAG: CDP-diacylglycerol--glycerol-3-phosphate 3-phosphatidyltransferase [Candidatus Eutrophobiaceae bacterium]
MIFNIPNILTLLRIACIPLLVVVFSLSFDWANQVACGIFVLAALTDLLDGWLARWLNQTSNFGAFLDPVADKLIVSISLILLVWRYPHLWMVFPACVIVGREFAVSALRELTAEMGARSYMAVSKLGKLKTTMQMIAIALLIYRDPLWDLPILPMGIILMYIAVILTLWSMWLYLAATWKLINRA